MNQLENIQCNDDADEETIEYERIQEAEIVDILSEEGIDEDTQNRIIRVIQQFHSGPLPSPEMLLKYNEMPGVVDIITNMAVSEMNHRHDMEQKMLESDVELNRGQINYVNASIELKKRLQVFSFIITMLLIVLGFVCLILNRNIASVTLFVSGIASLCFVLFYGKKSNDDEQRNSSPQEEEESNQ